MVETRETRSGEHGIPRRRAALLAIVWVLPGLGCAEHALAHTLDSAHYELHAALPTGDRITGMSGDHDHRHSHPESPPVVSTEGVKKLDAPVLLAAAVEPGPSRADPQSHGDGAIAHAAQRAAAVSGPRAPPIS